MNIYNNISTKAKRRDLRKNQTDAERKLWSILRNKRMNNLKFFRQYGVGSYILDFYCPKHRLAIELDGGQHGEDGQKIYDERRTAYLQQRDIRVLRFWNNEVLANLEAAAERITIATHNPTLPPLTLRGGDAGRKKFPPLKITCLPVGREGIKGLKFSPLKITCLPVGREGIKGSYELPP